MGIDRRRPGEELCNQPLINVPLAPERQNLPDRDAVPGQNEALPIIQRAHDAATVVAEFPLTDDLAHLPTVAPCATPCIAQLPVALAPPSAATGEHYGSYYDQGAWEIVDGEHRSPIDIETDTVVKDYGQTIKATVENATTEINGRAFTLEQFHFHAQSEHTVDWDHFPMEIHFVNEASDVRYAVVVVFTRKARKTPHSARSPLHRNLPAAVSLADLMPTTTTSDR